MSPETAGNGPVIPVTVHGASGRMGRLVVELVENARDLRLVALVDAPGRERPAGELHPRLPVVGQERLAEVHPRGGVVVDFSLAAALPGLLEQAARGQAALVVGTTGFDPEQERALEAYAARWPVVRAANFSIGVPALRLVLQLLARTLPERFQAEQVETHHVHKQDRPSGTARWLADAWTELRGTEVPTHAVRLGEVVGEHTWLIGDAEEMLVVTHRAQTRRAFLRGVLPAVRFAASREHGLYGLTDVLRSLADAAARRPRA
ncbi:MAG: 4-hydroxy-tetrahydrodipicolinate reductase [Candidatus Krumholzibacteriia bacterium]